MPHALLRDVLTRLGVIAALALLPVAAAARGHAPQVAQSISASAGNPALLARALLDLGHGNFTGFSEPWCADAVSAWLTAIGRAPLRDHTASSALSYGPLARAPAPGDLIVMRHHVGIVIAGLGDELEIVSGNWGRQVARARVARRTALAFVHAG